MQSQNIAATLHPKLGLTMAEAEVVSGFSRAQLYRFIANGQLPSLKTGRTARVVLRSDLEAFMQARRSLQARRPHGAEGVPA